MLLLKSRARWKPPGIPRLDLTNPLARDLCYCWTFAHHLKDVVRGNDQVQSLPTSPAVLDYFGLANDGGARHTESRYNIPLLDHYTVAVRLRNDETRGGRIFVTGNLAGSNDGDWQIDSQSSGTAVRFWYDDGAETMTSTGWAAGDEHWFIAAVGNTGARLYKDNVLADTGNPGQIGNGPVRLFRSTVNSDPSRCKIGSLFLWTRPLPQPQVLTFVDDPFSVFERRVWVPVEAGPPGPVPLDIDDLRHARPVDQVDVAEVITIVPIDINGLRHGRRVDSITIGVSVDLFVASLRHVRPVDSLVLDVSVDFAIDNSRHGRLVDVLDVQELVGVVLDVTDQRHARPVDSVLLDVEQPVLIDGLRHGRPVDAVGVQPLLGDQTGIGVDASTWILDAGQPLNNASSVDFDYHVLEGIFNSDQSVLGVDGARVTGPAGMRELTALTLGANVDGQERVQGEIAELRIYAGALDQADRDRILQELATKWITG